jgi:hypothetical protein
MAAHPDFAVYSPDPNWLICACVTTATSTESVASIRRSAAHGETGRAARLILLTADGLITIHAVTASVRTH